LQSGRRRDGPQDRRIHREREGGGVLTVPEAATRLTVSKSTLRRLLDDGSIAYIRVSKRIIRIEESVIERYLAERRVCPSEPKTAVGLLSFSPAGSAFIAAARAARRKRKPRRSKTSSEGKSLRLVTSG
jgi:excisionase family DNA binding protein